MRLGVIADDFTGAVDIAGFLNTVGMRTVLCFGVDEQVPSWAQAIVICLKIRSIDPKDAVAQALDAYSTLHELGCDKFYYKYCSTFDSTHNGNIGQVCDALRHIANATTTVICPALPVNGRTVYNGYLFVKDQLLGESPMRLHPVNPMTESKIERILRSQTSASIRNLPLPIVRAGKEVLGNWINRAIADEIAYIICDAIDDCDIASIAQATTEMPLCTGGSALGAAIAATQIHPVKVELPPKPTYCSNGAILAGSCSQATLAQIHHYQHVAPCLHVDLMQILSDTLGYARTVADWVENNQGGTYWPLVFSSSERSCMDVVPELALDIEHFFAELARILDLPALIVAGGETSSAVVQALHLGPCEVVMQIDPGVSWIWTLDKQHLLALKSGNFGSEQFFTHAQRLLGDRGGDE